MANAGKHTGGCLCGAVRFEIVGALAPIQLCYCSQCRKAQGGAFASNIPVAAEAFSLVRGVDLLAHFQSSPGKERAFCAHCGSPVYSRRTASPGVLRVRAGLIDAPLNTALAHHAYTDDCADWWDIEGDLPRYPQAAP